MGRYGQALDRTLGRVVEVFTFMILALLVAMIFISVLSRYVFNFSLAWAEELAGLFFVWLTLLGSVTAVRKRTHMAITFLLQQMDRRKQRWMNLYINGAMAFFLLVMIWKGTEIFLATIRDYSAVLRVPIGLYYLSLPVCGFLMLLFASKDLVQLLRGKTGEILYEGKEE